MNTLTRYRYRGMLLLLLPVIAFLSSGSVAAQPPGSSSRTETPRVEKPRETNRGEQKKQLPAAGADVQFIAPNTSVALLVRELNTASGRNIVLMNGLETMRSGPYKDKHSSQEWVDLIATDAGLRVDRLPAYDFLFPPGYEALTQTTVAGQLDPTLAARKTSLHFDLDTPIVSAFALLSHTLKTTIVADNVVADARCGEVHLTDVTVGEAVDALLKSARVAEQSLRVLGDSEQVLLYSAGRPLRQQPLVLAAGETRSEVLDRRVTIHLPSIPDEAGRLSGYSRAIPLSQALAELAKQTGLHFEADARSQQLPVNPAVITNLKLETALNLIVNQWPVPHYGYRVHGDTVRFVFLGPPVSGD